jgi:hypothetical protein
MLFKCAASMALGMAMWIFFQPKTQCDPFVKALLIVGGCLVIVAGIFDLVIALASSEGKNNRPPKKTQIYVVFGLGVFFHSLLAILLIVATPLVWAGPCSSGEVTAGIVLMWILVAITTVWYSYLWVVRYRNL